MKKLLIFLALLFTTPSSAAVYGPPTAVKEMVVTTVDSDHSLAPVTTSGYTTLVASLSSATVEADIFDSSGKTLMLKFTQNAVTKFLIVYPGGNGRVPLVIDSGSSVQVTSISSNVTSGEMVINFFR